jgi:hypothetical protein
MRGLSFRQQAAGGGGRVRVWTEGTVTIALPDAIPYPTPNPAASRLQSWGRRPRLPGGRARHPGLSAT